MKHKIVCCLGFGDSGKGSITDFLTREQKAKWTIRFSGGPQCSHHVETGTQAHNFHQFGSGSFAGANTIYSEHALFDPYALIREAYELAALGIRPKFYVHENCVVITPAHVLKNLQEAEKSGHGSTGSGCWAALEDSLTNPDALRAKDIEKYGFFDKIYETSRRFNFSLDYRSLDGYWQTIKDGLSVFEVVDDNWIAEQKLENVILEGNQGLLIDPDWGFHPNITANSTTPEKAIEFINKYCPSKEYDVVGVIRAYMTRHGAGVFPSEDKDFYIEEHNPPSKYTGKMRYGFHDSMMHSYALSVVKPDILAISCLDQPFLQDKFVCGYKGVSEIPQLKDKNDLTEHEARTKIISEVEPIWQKGKPEIEFPRKILSYGPTWKDKYYA